MARVGVRELKAKASEIVRDVREKRTRYVVTHRGKPVAELVPLTEQPEDGLIELVRLARELETKPVPPGESLQDLMKWLRRDHLYHDR